MARRETAKPAISALAAMEVASAGADRRRTSTTSQQSQVVRVSIIQTTFRQFREYEKERFAVSPPEDTNETPGDEILNIARWDDLLNN